MTRTGHRVAVAGWIGSTNLGDELIFAAIRQKLEELGAGCVAITIDPRRTEHDHGCATIRHRGPRDSGGLWRHLADCDAMVFGGGGLLQSETSPWNLPFHLSRLWLARTRRIPWAGIGLGAGRIDGAISKQLAARSLRSGVGLTVRDPASAHALQSVGVANVVVSADPVVARRIPRGAEQDWVAVSLRQPNVRGVRTAASRGDRSVNDEWLASIAESLDFVSRTAGLSVRFVALQPDRDAPLHEAVAERMTETVSFGDVGSDAVLGDIAASKMVVAMRYHSAVAALISGRPAAVIDYSPKMAALVDDVGPGMQLCGSERLAGSVLWAALEQAQENAAGLESSLARLRRRESENVKMLERLLDSV